MGRLWRSLARRLIRTAFRRGLREGSRSWLALGAAVWLLRHAFRPRKPVVRRRVLRRGESITVSNTPVRSRRRRRSGATSQS